MKIEKVDFGSIVINGKKYTEDVIITNDSVETKESSHNIKKEDIENLLLFEPDIIILGTGTSGMVKVPNEIKDFIKSEEKRLIIEKTPEAARKFNELRLKYKIAGIFHLTC